MIAAEVLFDPAGNPDHEYVEDQMSAIETWCTQHLGPEAPFSDTVGEKYLWKHRQYLGFVRFQFARESDATMFKLRWMR